MAVEKNVIRSRKSKNRQNKINLVFDENKRRDFLTGFHKRKLQRKKEAKEKFERDLKEERKRIKAEAKESYKRLVVSHAPIPELENLITEEYEDDDVTVKVVELSTNEIAKKNNWIGGNQPRYELEEENEDKQNQKEEVPGMELKRKPKVQKVKEEKVQFKSEKEVKKALKKQATNTVKKSKVFQMKNKLERQKEKKKSLQMKRQRMKIHSKKQKKKNVKGKGNNFKSRTRENVKKV